MCDPVTALVSVAAAGQVLGAVSSIQGSQAQASALKKNAQSDIMQGYSDELDYRDQARAKLGDQIAALSDRGVDISTATPLDLLRASARNQEVDALRIRADGIQKYQTQRAQASATLKSGMLTAGGQLLSGAAQAALGGLGKMGGSAPIEGVTITPQRASF